MLNQEQLRRYYERGWELPLLKLCDVDRLRRSPFRYRILPVVDLVRIEGAGTYHVLDVGCGVGTTSILIAGRHANARFTCIDISERQIEAGREYVRSAGLEDRFRFVVGDVTAGPLAVDRFINMITANRFAEGVLFLCRLPGGRVR